MGNTTHNYDESGGRQICRDPVVDRAEAEAFAEAASEAVASEAADLAVADTAEEALAAREAREARILVGASALALAAGITDRIITVAAVLAA